MQSTGQHGHHGDDMIGDRGPRSVLRIGQYELLVLNLGNHAGVDAVAGVLQPAEVSCFPDDPWCASRQKNFCLFDDFVGDRIGNLDEFDIADDWFAELTQDGYWQYWKRYSVAFPEDFRRKIDRLMNQGTSAAPPGVEPDVE